MTWFRWTTTAKEIMGQQQAEYENAVKRRQDQIDMADAKWKAEAPEREAALAFKKAEVAAENEKTIPVEPIDYDRIRLLVMDGLRERIQTFAEAVGSEHPQPIDETHNQLSVNAMPGGCLASKQDHGRPQTLWAIDWAGNIEKITDVSQDYLFPSLVAIGNCFPTWQAAQRERDRRILIADMKRYERDRGYDLSAATWYRLFADLIDGSSENTWPHEEFRDHFRDRIHLLND